MRVGPSSESASLNQKYNAQRYPHLEREPSTPARLDDILAARK
jgi:hypothetical protein